MNTLIPSLSFFLVTSAGMAAEWTKHIIEPAGKDAGSVNTAVAADFDGDGALDIMASFGGKVVIYAGPDWKKRITAHRFPASPNGRPARGGCIHSTLMDVDGDGDPDFVGSNRTVFWLECPDDPFTENWTYRTVDDEIKGTHCLITGDVDQDGKLDLIANSFQTADKTSVPHAITWQKIPQDPKSAKHWERHVFAEGDAPGGNHYMGFGDLNHDGRPDIACGAKGGENFPGGQWFAWWEQPKGGKLPWKKHLLAENEVGATNILPVDLDGDGVLDLAASRGHGKGMLWFKGPAFKKVEIDPAMDSPHSLAVADLDGDGDVDLATCSAQLGGTTTWYENDGKATFTRHDIDRNQSAYDIRLVDLNQDGHLDMLIAGHFSRNIVWYENPK